LNLVLIDIEVQGVHVLVEFGALGTGFNLVIFDIRSQYFGNIETSLEREWESQIGS